MQHKIKYLLSIALTCALSIGNTILIQANDTVFSRSYAPYAGPIYFEYLTNSSEFDDYEVEVTFPPNDEGIYQFNLREGINNTIYVFQRTVEGIYELAYFPEEDPNTDFRYRADSIDGISSLYFPSELSIGQVFYRGYSGDQPMTVTNILNEFTVDNRSYEDVVVIESSVDNWNKTTYYAPLFGIIAENNQSHDGQLNVTTELASVEFGYIDFEPLSYDEAVAYANRRPDKVEEYEQIIEDGIGKYHPFTREQLNALPDDAYYNGYINHQTNMATGGDPGTSAYYLSVLYPDIIPWYDEPSTATTSENTPTSVNPDEIIDREAVLNLLMTPDVLNESLTRDQANAIFDQIIADIDNNYARYSGDGNVVFYNAINNYIPANFSTGLSISIPDYFLPYIEAKAAAAGSTTNNNTAPITEASAVNAEYSVSADELQGNLFFESNYPSRNFVELSFIREQLSYQGNLANDPGLYQVRATHIPVERINVAYYNGSGSREVYVTHQLSIQGPTAHYHYNTDSAYLFYNAVGGISLALPDFYNELTSATQPTWIEYYLER